MIDRLRSRLGTSVVALLLLAGAMLAAVLATGPAQEGPPLDPDSVAEDGTRALTELLERLGADVVVDVDPPEAADSLLLLIDVLDETAREDLRARAEAGATLVLVDPRSPLAPEPVGSSGIGLLETPIARSCDLAALRDVARVQPGDDLTFDPPAGAVGCFPRGAGTWLVAEPVGEGWLVVTGGPRWVTNASLGEADNAALAVALLAPREGAVVGVVPPHIDAGAAPAGSPIDLVADWVWAVVGQLVVAAVLLASWRARRLGAPLVEARAVALPGSELVLALGHLRARRGDAPHAGRTIRRALRRDSARRTGLAPDASAEQVAEAALRVGAPESAVACALTDDLPDTDTGLVALARAAEEVRTAISTGGAGPGIAPDITERPADPAGIAHVTETEGTPRG